jgi:diphosphomevalonate decarboxylase
VILVVSDKEKDMASTAGMETSRLTSPLLKYRAEHVVEERLADIEKAFLAKDFNKFGEITMKDSNQFHAVCLDTYPPIFYMNDVSKAIISLVGALNEHYGEIRAAYTFDAGPNAVIYTLDKVCSQFSIVCLTKLFIYFLFSSVCRSSVSISYQVFPY